MRMSLELDFVDLTDAAEHRASERRERSASEIF
jgi:hypothetical protein